MTSMYFNGVGKNHPEHQISLLKRDDVLKGDPTTSVLTPSLSLPHPISRSFSLFLVDEDGWSYGGMFPFAPRKNQGKWTITFRFA